jgi:hypothetical protein
MNAACLGKNAVAGGAGCHVFTIRPSCLIGILVDPEWPPGRDVSVTVVWLSD